MLGKLEAYDIEKVQMRATEMIEGMSYIDYGERLKLFLLTYIITSKS